MGKLLDKLKAGDPAYTLEVTGDGYVLVGDTDHRNEFDGLVRELLNRPTDEFVILPVTDGHTGYDRAIILPL